MISIAEANKITLLQLQPNLDTEMQNLQTKILVAMSDGHFEIKCENISEAAKNYFKNFGYAVNNNMISWYKVDVWDNERNSK